MIRRAALSTGVIAFSILAAATVVLAQSPTQRPTTTPTVSPTTSPSVTMPDSAPATGRAQ